MEEVKKIPAKMPLQMNGFHDSNGFHSNGYHEQHEWCITASEMSCRTVNPIRVIVDNMKIAPNPNLHTISLSIGDPTVFGNLLPHWVMLDAVEGALRSNMYNGYVPAVGLSEARKAIAEYMSVSTAPLTEKDIIITSACSGAIEICLGTIANPGDTILIPKPGFSLYKTIAISNGVECKYYNLLPEREWEVDLDRLEALIDARTKCIVVNNPSNPCGSVYSKEHLEAILKIADRHKVLVIADEIYARSVFAGEVYHSMASLTTTVPVLSCCAISKRFLVPGWRLGWIEIHDRNDLLSEIRPRLFAMATRILGANTIIQGALPKILRETPSLWFEKNMAFIKKNADFAYSALSRVKALRPIRPKGAMYMLVGIDKTILTSINDDVHFTETLMSTKSVFCLPASCFAYPDFFRIVLTVPHEKLCEACGRIREFCDELTR